MKIYPLLEELLLELSAGLIYKKYYQDKIKLNEFIRIAESDPQTKLTGEDGKLGRYVKLLVNLYLRGNLKREDLPKAKEYLTYVYKYAIPLPLGKITTLNDIYELVKKYMAQESSNLGGLLNHLDKNEYKIFH